MKDIVTRVSRLGLLAFLCMAAVSTSAYPREGAAQVKKHIRLLRGPAAEARAAAAKALGELGSRARAAVPELRLALADGDAAVRESAAEALGRIGAADEGTLLSLRRLFSEPDPYVAGKAIAALAGIGAPAVDGLELALADPNDGSRRCAAIALGKIAPQGRQAIPFLTAALKDKSADVRWCAAIALGDFREAAAPAVPEMLLLLRDDDRDVRWAAHVSLAKIDKGRLPAAPATQEVIDTLQSMTPVLMAELKVPGAAISVIRGRRLAWSGSFGVADVSRPAAVSGRTLFEACSMSKPVFAYLVLKLVEQGKLDLDKPLGEHLRERFVAADDADAGLITARMLLTHTSGLPNWRKGGEERDGPLPVYFTPGSRFSYSGEGIYYLQRVVEHITGEPLAAHAARDLFDKLGMESTSYVWTAALDGRIATGHDAAGAALPRSRYTHANAAYTLYTTPEEYAKFILRIMNPDPADGASLSADSIREMLRRQVRMDTREPIDRPGRSLGLCGYRGLGWVIDETIGGDIAYHSGSNQTGFTCYSQFDMEAGSGIVVMTNGKNGSELWSRLIAAVGDL
jgi:CubicO group peptidase (beta-lactamase class C family)